MAAAQTGFLFAALPPGRRLALATLVLALVLATVVVVALGSGSSSVAYGDVVRILLTSVGFPPDTSIPASQVTIVEQVRLPRIAVAALIGAGLAAAGVVMQGVFRNPLADPGILGVSAGGATGAVLAYVSGLALAGLWVVPLFAFGGALLAALGVYTLSLEGGRANVTMLVLAGIAINTFLGALISAALLSTEEWTQLQTILTWLVGGLAGRGWRHAAVIVLPVAVCLALMLGYTRDLNLFLMGEETAQSLGTNVARTRFVLLALAALATGAGVSIAGPIGFVGLVVPHILRLLLGPDHRVLLPASALGGAAFLVFADALARLVIRYQEVPVGVITGLLGGPFFLYLLWRYRHTARLL
jgi:iron complex transport system permease protein